MRGIGHGSGQIHERPDARERLVWVGECVGVQRHDGGLLIDDPDHAALQRLRHVVVKPLDLIAPRPDPALQSRERFTTNVVEDEPHASRQQFVDEKRRTCPGHKDRLTYGVGDSIEEGEGLPHIAFVPGADFLPSPAAWQLTYASRLPAVRGCGR